MTGDDLTRGDGHAVPIEAFAAAVARYAVKGETVVLKATNESFKSTFTLCDGPQTLRDWWDRNGLAARDTRPDALQAALFAGEPVETTVRTTDGTTHRLRAVPDEDPATGTLTLRERPVGTDTRAVGDHIASVVSHDLRNPLDVAKARARAARETGATEHFDRLDRAHDRMERITGDVLTLARGSGAVDTTAGVSVAVVTRDAWQAVETGPASLNIASDLPEAEADADRLQRLLENLFRNAVEHGSTSTRPQSDGGDGPATPLTVTVSPTDGGFAVADDGQGIPPGERERVFDPGYTVSDGGTGLGLTIVRRIATAHDWTVIAAESEAGGARFEVTGLT